MTTTDFGSNLGSSNERSEEMSTIQENSYPFKGVTNPIDVFVSSQRYIMVCLPMELVKDTRNSSSRPVKMVDNRAPVCSFQVWASFQIQAPPHRRSGYCPVSTGVDDCLLIAGGLCDNKLMPAKKNTTHRIFPFPGDTITPGRNT